MGKAKRKKTGANAHRGNLGGRGNVNAQSRKPAWRWPLAVTGIGVVILVGMLFAGGDESPDDGAHLDVRVPELSPSAQAGEVAFDENCARCHGRNAAGTNSGPPLVHRLYEPSHHGNAAFWRATQQGVQAHHWKYGNMPRIGLSESEMGTIVGYVRELQQANGIR